MPSSVESNADRRKESKDSSVSSISVESVDFSHENVKIIVPISALQRLNKMNTNMAVDELKALQTIEYLDP